MDQNDDAQEQRDHARGDDPAPRRSALHIEAEEDPHDARRDKRGAKEQRQPDRGEQKVLAQSQPFAGELRTLPDARCSMQSRAHLSHE